MSVETLGLYSLGLFSQKYRLVNFYSTPLGSICKRCFSGSHSVKHCSAEHKCGICASIHMIADYKCSIPLCRGGYSCKHKMKCARYGEKGHRGQKYLKTQAPPPVAQQPIPILAAPIPRAPAKQPIPISPIQIEPANF